MRWIVAALSAVAVGGAPAGALISGTVSLPDKFSSFVGEDWLQAASVKVVGPGETFETTPLRNGQFDIYGVPPGTYQLLVHHPILHFDAIHVEVSYDDLKVVAHLMDAVFRKGPQRLKVPFGLAPSNVQGFYKKREPFNIMSILMNPMALMMLFMCGMMFIMPKITPELSEEDKKAIAEEGGFAAKMMGLTKPEESGPKKKSVKNQ